MIITLKQEMDKIIELAKNIRTVSSEIYEDVYLVTLILDLIEEAQFVKMIFGEGYKKEDQK